MGFLQRLVEQALGERSAPRSTVAEPWVPPSWAPTAPSYRVDLDAQGSFVATAPMRQQPVPEPAHSAVEPSLFVVPTDARVVEPPIRRALTIEPKSAAEGAPPPARPRLPAAVPDEHPNLAHSPLPFHDRAEPLLPRGQPHTREVVREHHTERVATRHLLERIIEPERSPPSAPAAKTTRAPESSPAAQVASKVGRVVPQSSLTPLVLARPFNQHPPERLAPRAAEAAPQAIHIAIGRVVITAPSGPPKAPERASVRAGVNLGEYLASTDRKRRPDR